MIKPTLLVLFLFLRQSMQCIVDNAYLEIQASAEEASVKLTGQELFPETSKGINFLVLDKKDMHIKTFGALAASSTAAVSDILSAAKYGDFLILATQTDSYGIASETVALLEDEFGASVNISKLATDRQYLLVSKRGASAPIAEEFSAFNETSKTWEDVKTRVCVSDMLSCADDGSTKVLMGTSGGSYTHGYAASIMVGSDFLTTNEQSSGLYVAVIDQQLNVKGDVHAFLQPASFIEWFDNTSFNSSDYLVLVVNTDASAVLLNATVQNLLKSFPHTLTYTAKSGYLLAARQEDTEPLFEHSSNITVAISAACISTHTFAPTVAPTYAPTFTPTLSPTSVPTVYSSFAPTPQVTSKPTSVDSKNETISTSTKSSGSENWASTPTGLGVIVGVSGAVFLAGVAAGTYLLLKYRKESATLPK